MAPDPAMSTPERTLCPYHTHILVAGSWSVTASSQPTQRPVVLVTGFDDDKTQFTIPCESLLADMSHITALALDQSPPVARCLRLACFLSTGEFVIWSLSHSKPGIHSLQHRYIPTGRTERTIAPVVHGVYHHPLLTALTRSFSLSLYDTSSKTVQHTQTVTSFTSFPPASLVLSTPSPSTYKLVLAHAIPMYPAHWSLGATEFMIHGGGSTSQNSATSMLGFSSDTPSTGPDALTVRSTRTVRTVDVPRGWIDEDKLRAMKEQWERKVSLITDTQTDGKWVVLAPGDRLSSLASPSAAQDQTTPSLSTPLPVQTSMVASPMHSASGLQLYRLSLPPHTSISASPPKLTFVRTLHGQMGPITALALADGRCVSLGRNGSIWVWDLENGTGAEVAAGDFAAIDAHPEPVIGAVVFDEKRIISALGAGNVVVRRFDI